MTKANLNRGWLTVSEVQSIIIMAGSMAVMLLKKELKVLHLDLQEMCATLGT